MVCVCVCVTVVASGIDFLWQEVVGLCAQRISLSLSFWIWMVVSLQDAVGGVPCDVLLGSELTYSLDREVIQNLVQVINTLLGENGWLFEILSTDRDVSAEVEVGDTSFLFPFLMLIMHSLSVCRVSPFLWRRCFGKASLTVFKMCRSAFWDSSEPSRIPRRIVFMSSGGLVFYSCNFCFRPMSFVYERERMCV